LLPSLLSFFFSPALFRSVYIPTASSPPSIEYLFC
jgi:hypothetical protein